MLLFCWLSYNSFLVPTLLLDVLFLVLRLGFVIMSKDKGGRWTHPRSGQVHTILAAFRRPCAGGQLIRFVPVAVVPWAVFVDALSVFVDIFFIATSTSCVRIRFMGRVSSGCSVDHLVLPPLSATNATCVQKILS